MGEAFEMGIGRTARCWLAVAVVIAGTTAQAHAQFLQTEASPMARPSEAELTKPLSKSEEKDPSVARTLPNAPSYTPLSGSQKFHIFLQQTHSPYVFATTAFDAGLAQLSDDWPAYGQGMEGYGKRYGALLANHAAASFFESFLLPTAFHQDPRYFRRGAEDRFLPRLGYSASRVFITRTDDGHSTFNTSLVLGMLLVASLTNSYYPRTQRGFEETMSRFGGGLIFSAQNNLLREFWPDLSRIFHRHEPQELREIEKLAKRVPLAGKLASNQDSRVVQPARPAHVPASDKYTTVESPR